MNFECLVCLMKFWLNFVNIMDIYDDGRLEMYIDVLWFLIGIYVMYIIVW